MRERMVREQSDLMSTEPLAWGRSVWWLTSRRAPEVILHNYATLAAEFQVTLAHPLLDEGFLAALAREGGLLGLTSRTAAMEHLFGDVLPRELIHRQQKSRFNRAFMGRPTREFASGWDGSGVDSANVDATILRECWLSDEPPALSMTLLHVAWLASQGLTTMGEP
jgi:asparagine synthase (glutamine-hydrolysing)